MKPFDHEITNQSKTKLQDQFSGESLATFFKLLLQVCAKSVNNHEPIPGKHKEYFFSTSKVSDRLFYIWFLCKSKSC